MGKYKIYKWSYGPLYFWGCLQQFNSTWQPWQHVYARLCIVRLLSDSSPHAKLHLLATLLNSSHSCLHFFDPWTARLWRTWMIPIPHKLRSFSKFCSFIHHHSFSVCLPLYVTLTVDCPLHIYSGVMSVSVVTFRPKKLDLHSLYSINLQKVVQDLRTFDSQI